MLTPVGAFGGFWRLRLLLTQLHSQVEIQRQTPDQPRRGGHSEESWLQTLPDFSSCLSGVCPAAENSSHQ